MDDFPIDAAIPVAVGLWTYLFTSWYYKAKNDLDKENN